MVEMTAADYVDRMRVKGLAGVCVCVCYMNVTECSNYCCHWSGLGGKNAHFKCTVPLEE